MQTAERAVQLSVESVCSAQTYLFLTVTSYASNHKDERDICHALFGSHSQLYGHMSSRQGVLSREHGQMSLQGALQLEHMLKAKTSEHTATPFSTFASM